MIVGTPGKKLGVIWMGRGGNVMRQLISALSGAEENLPKVIIDRPKFKSINSKAFH